METTIKKYALYKLLSIAEAQATEFTTITTNVGSILYYRAGYCYLTGTGRIFDKVATNILNNSQYEPLDLDIEEAAESNNLLGAHIPTQVLDELYSYNGQVGDDIPVVSHTLPTPTKSTQKRDTLAALALKVLIPTLPEVSETTLEQATKLSYLTADSMLDNATKTTSELREATANTIAMQRGAKALQELTDAAITWLDDTDTLNITVFIQRMYRALLGEELTEDVTIDLPTFVGEVANELGIQLPTDFVLIPHPTNTKATLVVKGNKYTKDRRELTNKAIKWWSRLPDTVQTRIAKYNNLYAGQGNTIYVDNDIVVMFTVYHKILGMKAFLLGTQHTLLALNWWDMLGEVDKEGYYTASNLEGVASEPEIKEMYTNRAALATAGTPHKEPKEVVGYLTLDEFKQDDTTFWCVGNGTEVGLPLAIGVNMKVCSSYQEIKVNGCAEDRGYTGRTIILKLIQDKLTGQPIKLITYGKAPTDLVRYCEQFKIELDEAIYCYSLDGVTDKVYIPNFKVIQRYPVELVEASSLHITGDKLFTLDEAKKLAKIKRGETPSNYIIWAYLPNEGYKNDLFIKEQY